MSDWKLEVIRVDNGYLIKIPEEVEDGKIIEKKIVIQNDEKDEIKSHEDMLWEIMEHFSFYGSKHDKERIRVVRETHDGDLIFSGAKFKLPITVELENK